MPRAKGVKFLPVYMAEQAQEQVKAFAAEQGYKSGGEYLRSLIEKDMTAKGQPVDFGLTEWGKGRSKKPTDQQPTVEAEKPKRSKKMAG